MPSYAITGANRGIGFEFVRHLSSDPKNTVIALIRSKNNAPKIEALKAKNVHIFEADITDAKALLAAADGTSKITGGSLDVLINNAAYVGVPEYITKTFNDFTGDASEFVGDIEKAFHVNVSGPILTINAFLPLLKKGTQKKIIIISSGLGDSAFVTSAEWPYGAGYCISKSPLTMLTVNYATVLKNEGFIVLAISPGVVNTKESPPTAEELEGFGYMVQSFRKAYPDFSGEPITPKESVDAMLGIFDGLKAEDSGKFISHKGNLEWL